MHPHQHARNGTDATVYYCMYNTASNLGLPVILTAVKKPPVPSPEKAKGKTVACSYCTVVYSSSLLSCVGPALPRYGSASSRTVYSSSLS